MDYTVKILSISEVTHNVRCIITEKPDGYLFTPGQATEVAINKSGWSHQKRPFTFTCLNNSPFLEFTIKCYTDHKGVTGEIKNLVEGDELIISDCWGTINYKGEGYFIAGGAGITPFISIFRQLHKDKKIGKNKLFFSNRTPEDIIYKDELETMLGKNAVLILTEGIIDEYIHDFINEAYIKKQISDFTANFYVCGPEEMVNDISRILIANGAKPDMVIFEK